MSRKLKVLGLALVAVFAMSALAASGASAAVEHTFTSTTSPTGLTGAQVGEHSFTAQGKTIKCTSATFTGTVTGTTADKVSVYPEYTGCKFNGIEATVSTLNCEYTFDSDTTESADFPAGEEHAPVEITCSNGPITISVGGLCTISIGAQTVHGVSYVAEGSGSTADMLVKATVKTITNTVSGGLCFLAGIETGTRSDGEYVGNTTVKGYVDNGNTSSGGKTSFSEGSQVGIGLTTP